MRVLRTGYLLTGTPVHFIRSLTNEWPTGRLRLPRIPDGAVIRILGALGIICLAIAWGCSRPDIVKVDGSSTVFPITEAMAEEFSKRYGETRVTVGVSGTGGGFKKFCRGEIDITGASRPVKPVELEKCSNEGIEFIELPVAFDGLSVMVNPDNDWVDFLTVEELREIWQPGSTVSKWSDVRPEWPDRDILLVGADTDSGTFDYFTTAVVGEEGASRPDYIASSDDNVLVRAVAGEKGALGYVGYAFVVENSDSLRVVPIDGGAGPVFPTIETISSNTYAPLSRPLFIYVNSQGARRSDVQEFVRFYLNETSGDFIREVGYVTFQETDYRLVQQRFERGITGSVFGGKGSQIGITIKELLGGD